MRHEASSRARLAAWCALPLVGVALGCGSAEAGSTPGYQPPTTVIKYYADTCPQFKTYTLTPKHVGLRTPSRVEVEAEDPEGGDIFYAWSASVGRITNDLGSSAIFHCQVVGPDIISILAFDPQGCDRVLNIYVNCDES